MTRISQQAKKWQSKFGRDYTDRNYFTVGEMNELCRRNYGITRSKLNQLFIGHLKRSAKILEVGANAGNQLLCLQKMGFGHLYGIEINSYAVEMAKSRANNINMIHGSGFDIPFRDNYFDLVFTSGLLIHIAPSDVECVLQEIQRCTKRYIWGFEYYSNKRTEIKYRGNKELLWKNDFVRLYLKHFNDLRLVKEKRLKYLQGDNVDTMFLLEKIE